MHHGVGVLSRLIEAGYGTFCSQEGLLAGRSSEKREYGRRQNRSRLAGRIIWRWKGLALATMARMTPVMTQKNVGRWGVD
jgi:hypothetical protein